MGELKPCRLLLYYDIFILTYPTTASSYRTTKKTRRSLESFKTPLLNFFFLLIWLITFRYLARNCTVYFSYITSYKVVPFREEMINGMEFTQKNIFAFNPSELSEKDRSWIITHTLRYKISIHSHVDSLCGTCWKWPRRCALLYLNSNKRKTLLAKKKTASAPH